MADVPGESIKDWGKVKPSSFAVWCLLCEVKKTDLSDVYLELETAQENGIGKSAYYFAFKELENKKWIEFSRHSDGKKWWKLVKGFERNSANVEKHDSEDSIHVENSANVEFYAETPVENSANVEKVGINLPDISANVEFSEEKLGNFSANVENSANVEKTGGKNSANVELHIRNKKHFKPQETIVSFGGEEVPPLEKPNKPKRSKPQPFRLPPDYPLTDEMIDWAKKELPGLNVAIAHENFVEHWSNRTDAKAYRLNWDLTWKKGMRMAFNWQQQNENGVKNGSIQKHQPSEGTGSGNQKRSNAQIIRQRDYSKFDGFDPIKQFG